MPGLGNYVKFKLEKSKVKAGKCYDGFINRNSVYGKNLRVYVELDDEPGVEYVKVIPIEKNSNSRFAQFARKMEIVNENGDVDTDLLNDLAVKVTLKRGKDENLYVNSLCIDYNYYEEEEGGMEDEQEE